MDEQARLEKRIVSKLDKMSLEELQNYFCKIGKRFAMTGWNSPRYDRVQFEYMVVREILAERLSKQEI